MLTRFLQAIAITAAIYLTMILSRSPVQHTALLVNSHRSPVRIERLTYLLAEMLDFLLSPLHKDA